MLIPFGVFSAGVSAGPTNSFELISTTILGSTSSIISFTSIPSTYKHLQIRFAQVASAGNAGSAMSLTFNSVGGTSYAYHWLVGSGSSVSSGASPASQSIMKVFGEIVGTDTTKPTVGIIDIFDYANTTTNKTVRAFAGIATGEVSLHSGVFMNTSAISSLTLGSPSAIGSRFSLYGIKG